MRPPRTDVRARRRALKAELKRRQRARSPRRGRWVLALLLLALLWWLRDCGDEVEESDPAPEEVAPSPAPTEPAAPVRSPLPELERIERFARPRFVAPAPDAVPWLEAWRLQVAARGPRLATCFEGMSNPGALRWSTRVDPASGRVSDHDLEPVLDTEPLSADQRACVLQTLTDPSYRLPDGPPSRASLVIEF